MKKIYILLVIITFLFLNACSNEGEVSTNDEADIKTVVVDNTNTKEAEEKIIVVDNTKVEYETISLTLDNYKKYITIYEQIFDTDLTKEERTYFNFYGASDCRFENCVITYEGTNSGTLELSMSGNGQIIIFGTVRGQLNIVSISGTVKYPKI